MTVQTSATHHSAHIAKPTFAPQPKAHWAQHTAHEFPRGSSDQGPNLATLDQLRSRGRNALLSPRHRRRAKPAGCTTC